jgi:hypothetical protein
MKRFLLSVVLVFCCSMARADTVYYFSGIVQSYAFGNQLIYGQFSLDPATQSITSFHFDGPNGPFSSDMCGTSPGACDTGFFTRQSDNFGIARFDYFATYLSQPYIPVQTWLRFHLYFNASDFASLGVVPISTPSNLAVAGIPSQINTLYYSLCDPCAGLPGTWPPRPPFYNDDGPFVSGAFSTDPSQVPEPCSAVMLAIGVAGIMSRANRWTRKGRAGVTSHNV